MSINIEQQLIPMEAKKVDYHLFKSVTIIKFIVYIHSNDISYITNKMCLDDVF